MLMCIFTIDPTSKLIMVLMYHIKQDMSRENFVLILLFFLTPVYGANWQEIGYKQYIDYSSWGYESGLISVWFKDLNPGHWDNFEGKKIWYRLSRIQFNCAKKEYNLKAVIQYDLKGNVLNSYYAKFNEWETIPPDTVIDAKYSVVCGSPNP